MSLSLNKMDALRLLLGSETADALIASADTTQKEAEATTAYKADDAPTIAELMEVWTAYKEAEAELADVEELADFEEEAELLAEKADGMAELKAGMARMEEAFKNLAALLGSREEEKKKEADIRAEEVAALKARLVELEGGAPRATGYRASKMAAASKDDSPSGEEDWLQQAKEVQDRLGPGVASFIGPAEKFAARLFD